LPVGQFESTMHPHTAEAAMQTGAFVSVTQTLSLVAEHTAHVPARAPPAGWHAGSAAVGHELWPGFVAE
jgi:hypothetical protein